MRVDIIDNITQLIILSHLFAIYEKDTSIDIIVRMLHMQLIFCIIQPILMWIIQHALINNIANSTKAILRHIFIKKTFNVLFDNNVTIQNNDFSIILKKPRHQKAVICLGIVNSFV